MISRYHRVFSANFFILGILLLTIASGVAPIFAQQSYTSESLFIALLSDGNALVEYDVGIADPLDKEIRIPLFGEQDIRNLIVVDYDDNVVKFAIGDRPNEIILNTPGVSNIRISYTTQDFLVKDRRDWIFSLNSTTGFSVKLPTDSILTDPGENSPSSIKFFGGQSLLTFDKPGNVRFVYVVGTLGTEEQANIGIRAAQTTIAEVSNQHQGIVLTSAKDLLQKAISARDGDRFADAETFADQANDAALAAGRDFEAAQKAINDAQNQIDKATSEGRDTVTARQQLQQANTQFAAGSYADSRNSANSAIASIGTKQPEPALPIFVIIAAIVAAAGGVGALVFLKMRKPGQLALQPPQKLEEPRDPAANSKATPVLRPPSVEVKEEEEEMDELDDSAEPVLESTSYQIPDSQIDKSILSRIVGRIIEDRPHLRPEDQQVLKFLVEKEGAAFESEIRSKFQLPKTTIWRLVKRLEREELVEIRKAGGQNLIKLKFEDKQA
jgi:hypothetical protein